jgi:hypothetical protein
MQLSYVVAQQKLKTETVRISVDTGTGTLAIQMLCPESRSLAVQYSFVGSGPGATLTLITPEDPEGRILVLTLTRQL